MLSLRGSILLSALFHAVLFLAVLLTSGTGGARVVYKPQYQVRLVRPEEVPSLAKPKAKKVVKPMPPPEVAKPKAKKVVVPDKKVEKPPAAKKRPEKKAEKQPEPKPAPAVEKPKDPAPEEVLEEALARIQKRAGSREKLAANMPAKSSGWEERQKEIKYNEYYDQVERAVRESWIPPQNMDFEEGSAMTVVSLTLLPDGRVLKSYIEEPSGDPQFDQSVMRAILKSTPFPPPPIGLEQQSFELGLRFHSTPQTP